MAKWDPTRGAPSAPAAKATPVRLTSPRRKCHVPVGSVIGITAADVKTGCPAYTDVLPASAAAATTAATGADLFRAIDDDFRRQRTDSFPAVAQAATYRAPSAAASALCAGPEPT